MSSTTNESPAAGEIPTTVQEVLNAIADDIEKHGHFQRPMPYSEMYDSGKGKGKCCLICNPTNPLVTGVTPELFDEAEQEIARRIGISPGTFGLASYSDNTSTEKVLAMLRAEQ